MRSVARFGRVWPIKIGPVAPSSTDRLDSWKEIAAYLNRGVRTVRRWETEEGLPVHRHVHRALGSVYAYKSEIDSWRQAGRRHATRPPPAGGAAKSIAVIPFASLSADPDNDYFVDGLTDEIISDLSKVRALRVISRTSSMAFKGTRKDVKTIGHDLGVRYILEGTVRRQGARLRISAQLIDAAADAHLWADKYEGTIEDVFEMQERLARVIVEALELRLTTEEDRRLAERPIRNVQAYECLLRARHEAWRWRKDAIDRAVQLIQRGLGIVGDNAALYAALGFAHLQYREAGIDLSERPLADAEACAEKLFAVDAQSAGGLQLRGWIRYARGHTQEAVYDLKLALERDPNNADTLLLLTNCYLISGKTAAARPLIARLQTLDPLTPLTRCLPGFADLSDGKLQQAIEPYRQMLEMDPGNPMARLFYVWLLMFNGDIETTRRVVETFPPEVSDTIPARLASFLAHALAGNRREALNALTPEIESIASAADVFPRVLAHGYALIGDADRAMHWLTIAVARGYINYPFLARYDPLLEGLRADPRFQELLRTVRERWESFQT
jgi:TolB-like protein